MSEFLSGVRKVIRLNVALGVCVFVCTIVQALSYDPGLLTEAEFDPSFEGATEKWAYTSTGSTYGSTTDPASDGSKTFRSTSSTTSYSGRTLTNSSFVTGITSGHEYKLEVGWFASGTEWADNRLELNIEWYDAGAALLSTSTAADLALTAQNTWELKTLTATAPANATQAKVLIRWKRLSGVTSGRQQSFDRIALVDLSTPVVVPNAPTPVSPVNGVETTNVFPVFWWIHNDTNSTPQAMYHLQVAADAAFTAMVFEDTAVSSATTVRIATPIATPADSTLYWRVRTSNVTENFSAFPSAATFGLNNLVANPSFEAWAGPLVGDTAISWVKLASTTSNHVRQTDTPLRSGTRALQLQSFTLSFDRGMESDTATYFLPVTAGQGYRMGAWARKNNDQNTPDSYAVRMQIDWFDASNAPITTSSQEFSFSAFDVWSLFRSDTAFAPVGAAKAQFRIQAKRAGGIAQSSDHVYVDDVFVSHVVDAGSAPGVGSVVINEIMWDGLEYIELANPGASAVNIGGWKVLGDGSEEFTITSGATIPAGGYYLIATSGAVSFSPNQTATMTLLQEGELLTLTTATGLVIDTANQSGAWFAGQNTAEGIAMSRIDSIVSGTLSTNWADDLGNIGGRDGSPGQANVFDTGGGGSSGPLSDTEHILALLDTWVTSFETADTDLIKAVFSESSPMWGFTNDAAAIEQLRQSGVDYTIYSDTNIQVIDDRAVANIDIGYIANGGATIERGWNIFKFVKENGIWKMWEP